MNAQNSGPSPVLVGVLIPVAALVIALLAWLYPVQNKDDDAAKQAQTEATVSTPVKVVDSTTTQPNNPPTSAPTTAPPPATIAPAVYRVPKGFTGTWRGTLTQGSSQTYPVIVTLTTGIVGDSVATVEYPTLHCGGIWRLKSGSTNSISIEELIDPSTDGNCIATVPITLILNGTRLQYYIDDPVEVRGTLKK